MPRTRLFIDSSELYDAIYHFKDYAHESERLRVLIDDAVPGARTILDVACGTGEHAKFLKRHYRVDGIDLNESYLRAAPRYASDRSLEPRKGPDDTDRAEHAGDDARC